MNDYGIHWFRRDLRLTGNPALTRNLARHPGKVLGVFCFDREFLARPDFSANRFLFFIRTLEALREEMRASGGDLLCLDIGPDKAFRELFKHLAKHPLGLPKTISWNRDYEPFARERDARMQEFFERNSGVETLTERDHLFIEPTELQKKESVKEGSSFYQVYTPFMKKWLSLFSSPEFEARLKEVKKGLKAGAPDFALRWPKPSASFPFGNTDFLAHYRDVTEKKVSRSVIAHLPVAGHAAARLNLKKFRDQALEDYERARDFPGIAGTSRMSVYLKNGSITVPQLISILGLTPNSPHLKYFQELIWREFYYHVLYHCPRVETEAFFLKYKNLRWENDPQRFERWKEGRTGYPIVDAGMRELAQTGWMHNRVRMIVASFLTKDLLIDWRHGEKYFMEKLIDGDLAPNNGGWQWAASTGCDPQPYFRIFNPTSQGEKFDPKGDYIRKWLPELTARFPRGGKAKDLHRPHEPIVDHSVQREKALKLYRSVR